MKYISVIEWRDLTDKHLYHAGDSFPFDGRELPADRIASLVSGNNGAGIAVIKPVEETIKENITEESETPKTVKRSRKKTANAE